MSSNPERATTFIARLFSDYKADPGKQLLAIEWGLYIALSEKKKTVPGSSQYFFCLDLRDDLLRCHEALLGEYSKRHNIPEVQNVDELKAMVSEELKAALLGLETCYIAALSEATAITVYKGPAQKIEQMTWAERKETLKERREEEKRTLRERRKESLAKYREVRKQEQKAVEDRTTSLHPQCSQPVAKERQEQPPAEKAVLGFRTARSLHPPRKVGEDTRSETKEEFKGIEPRLVELIRNEIIVPRVEISWEDIAGVEHAKKTIQEAVIWPLLRPDLFQGLRGPPKGILLFGPPGTGKTMLGRCIASQAKASFFCISASSLTSKWVGEGEKMVRALFAVAKSLQPAVIFVDEIDSLLTQRTEGEMEATRRIKTEFLVQLDGAGTDRSDRILIVGATNRPQELDEAARRRLVKRLYIPLPDQQARGLIIQRLLLNISNTLSAEDVFELCGTTKGYSGSDMDALCREAALEPLRMVSDIMSIATETVRPVNLLDFKKALTQVRASVSQEDLTLYVNWNKSFGSISASTPEA